MYDQALLLSPLGKCNKSTTTDRYMAWIMGKSYTQSAVAIVIFAYIKVLLYKLYYIIHICLISFKGKLICDNFGCHLQH